MSYDLGRRDPEVMRSRNYDPGIVRACGVLCSAPEGRKWIWAIGHRYIPSWIAIRPMQYRFDGVSGGIVGIRCMGEVPVALDYWKERIEAGEEPSYLQLAEWRRP